jgi:hypothetical protein
VGALIGESAADIDTEIHVAPTQFPRGVDYDQTISSGSKLAFGVMSRRGGFNSGCLILP